MQLLAIPAVPYRRTSWWRRILSLGGLGIMGVVLGMILAIVVGVAIVLGFLAISGTAR